MVARRRLGPAFGGEKAVLVNSLNGGSLVQVGLTASVTLSSEEPIEVNAAI
jgi:hypothetical protein